MPFFDHINGGPPLPEAVQAMRPWLEVPANPQVEHAYGRRAHMALEAARAQVAGLIGARPADVLFGATGTEMNNLAVKGYLRANRRKGRHVLVAAVEHPSVERACRRLSAEGWDVGTLGVDANGRVDPEAVGAALRPDTALVCVQLANPEVGTVQPLADIARAVHTGGAALLADAVFAAGRMAVDVEALGVDLLTLSGPGLWGPAGAAALWVRRGVRIQPEADGGVQEGGRRGGLENVAAAVGMGAAAHHLTLEMPAHLAHLEDLAARLRGHLEPLPGVVLTGPAAPRAAGHVSLLVKGAEGQSLLTLLDGEGVAASSGSFCGAKAMKASPVLTAMGHPPEEAVSGIVFSLGPGNSAAEVDQGALGLRKCMDRIRGALAAGGSPG